MNKIKKKNKAKQPQRRTPPPQKNIKKAAGATFFDKAEKWLGNNSKLSFIVIAALYFFFAFISFNVRITESNDDALYIEAGYKYANDFFNYYYTSNAPLYPMFLSLLISIMGVKLIVFKLFSVLFNFLGLLFLYKAFKGRIPHLILFPVLLVTAVNSYFLYYASQTYTEAFYLFLSGVFFYSFSRLLDTEVVYNNDIRKTYKNWLVFGLFAFLLTMTRNVAVASIPAILVYFLLMKEFRNVFYFIISFGIFKGLFEVIKSLIWGSVGQYGSQSSFIFQKDPYNPAKGMEDLWGLASRYFHNSDLYISKRLFQMLGFKSPDSTTTSTVLTVLVVLLILWGLYRCFKSKNKILILSTVYFAAMLSASFIALATRWDQPRMIMIYLPLILFVILYGIYDIFKRTSTPVQTIFLFILIVISLSSLITSVKKANKNLPVLSKNLKGEKYAGYTPDWINYFKMSEWVGENMPDTALVACRKAPISFIHSNGKQFFPVYKVLYNNPDSSLAYFERNNVTHVILANLRRNPKKADGFIINTIHRILKPIADKYPQKLRVIHKVGEFEPAYLYEINYNAPAYNIIQPTAN
ncbi:MAG: hypothetical protein K8S00_13555 [Bacteroidales bacterium]|nr:hypothetical protein [Bacteroidales bacterium]